MILAGMLLVGVSLFGVRQDVSACRHGRVHREAESEEMETDLCVAWFVGVPAAVIAAGASAVSVWRAHRARTLPALCTVLAALCAVLSAGFGSGLSGNGVVFAVLPLWIVACSGLCVWLSEDTRLRERGAS